MEGILPILAFLFLTGAQGFLSPLSPHHDLYGTPPPVGSVWPRPYSLSRNSAFFSVDTKNLNIIVKNVTGQEVSCPNLDWAVEHYRELIASLNSESSPNADVSTVDIIITAADAEQACNAKFKGEAALEEQYEIEVQEVGNTPQVLISVNQVWAAVRGLETLYQLLWPANDDYSAYNLNITRILDFPRFSYRGMMLDTARHYLPEKMIIKILTIMMYNKFNVFHWHIIDDQSFPLVLKRFPELSEKGAYSSRHVYTQEAIARVMEAARVRGIRVILELDTPGHVNAIGKSHQEVLTPCFGDGVNPGTPNPPHHAAYENIDPTKEESYTFMRELFTEVIQDISQDTHIHLGMDEVYEPCWASSPLIKDFMKEHGYVNISQVQGHYTTRHVEMVQSLGAVPIAFQDPLDEGVVLDKGVIIQVWKDWTFATAYNEIINKGYKVILSACWYINYIDYGETWREYYECDPIGTTKVPEHQWNQVLGGEAALWAEYVDQTNIVARLFPFSSAVGAVLWDPSIRDGSGRENTDDAMHRLDAFRCGLLRRGVRAQPIMNGHCGPFEAGVQINY